MRFLLLAAAALARFPRLRPGRHRPARAAADRRGDAGAARRRLSGHLAARGRRERHQPRHLPRRRDDPGRRAGAADPALSAMAAGQSRAERADRLARRARGSPPAAAPSPGCAIPSYVYAFHVDVPAGVRELRVEFQHLSPTDSGQGRVTMTRAMLNLQWEKMSLYPAGYFTRGISVPGERDLPRRLDRGDLARRRRPPGQPDHLPHRPL